jgi:glycosyltransferase involved in cell wall biosynthesis
MNLGIYHVGTGFRDAGGKAVYNRKISIALAEEHDVTLYTGTPIKDRLKESDVNVVPLNRWFGHPLHKRVASRPYRLNSVLSFLKLKRDGTAPAPDDLDVIVTHKWYDDLAISRATSTPVVYQRHGYRGSGIGGKARGILSTTDHYIANSASTKREIEHETGYSIDGVVRPGVDPKLFNPDIPPAFESSKPTIAFVGRVAPIKGIHVLIDAFESIADRAELRIVGDGRARSEAEQQVRSLGIEDAVIFEGVVPNDELAGYYTGSDIVCHPSRYEGFGMTNLEAMACGSALVTTPYGVAEEVADAGRTHVSVEPESPNELAAVLERLLDDATRRDRLGREAGDLAKNQTWADRASKLVGVCRQFLDSDGSSISHETSSDRAVSAAEAPRE